MNDLLKLLGDQHNFWVGTVYSFGGKGEYAIPKQDAEAIVSDMYLKLNKYVGTPDRILHSDGTLNKTFVYVTLRNLFINYVNKDTKAQNILLNNTDLLQGHLDDEFDMDMAIQRKSLEDKILDEINSWHIYDARLFKLVFYEGHSMRFLSRETTISLSSIFNTIKSCKIKLRNKFRDEYEQLNN